MPPGAETRATHKAEAPHKTETHKARAIKNWAQPFLSFNRYIKLIATEIKKVDIAAPRPRRICHVGVRCNRPPEEVSEKRRPADRGN